MLNYLIRRLILLPVTLFGIVLVNFLIINLAPGEPTTVTEVTAQGEATRRENSAVAFGLDDRYLQFREHFGLTLPVLFNAWPEIQRSTIEHDLWSLEHHRTRPDDAEEMPLKAYDRLRIGLGDKARFLMPKLLQIAEDPSMDLTMRRMASRFFARGGTRQAYVGPHVNPEQRLYNRKVAADNQLLRSLIIDSGDSPDKVRSKLESMRRWYEANRQLYEFEPSFWQRVSIFLFETRFCKYMTRVLTLDFGTLRNDDTKSVIAEVSSRFKYSLTLAVLPMVITFFGCLAFGFLMACWQNRWPDFTLNMVFLVLYALPVFVVAPFLIEKVALGGHFPFTSIPIPLSGFTNPDSIYTLESSWQRVTDVAQHLFLPLIAILYGSLAVQARLARTAVLEVLHQDYVRTAYAKGVPPGTVLVRHVGRNAAITLVTSIAGSLGIVLGGSLIVETLFDIHGFGKFFYDAIVNWDYNVIMFSAFAGSLLTLVGYLVADIAYTLLDPRLTLE